MVRLAEFEDFRRAEHLCSKLRECYPRLSFVLDPPGCVWIESPPHGELSVQHFVRGYKDAMDFKEVA